METIAIIGAGSVGRALGGGLTRAGHHVTYGVRDTSDPRHGDLARTATVAAAVAPATVVVLTVPAASVVDLLPTLGLRAGQVVIDATNAVGRPVPEGFATMGELVAHLVPDGVHVAKAFNTVGAEHLGDGARTAGRTFLPVAGDPAAVTAVTSLATDLGFDVAPLGGRERFGMVEEHAKLWIHLAFACGWGRGFTFSVVRP